MKDSDPRVMGKRILDIVCSSVGLLLLLPLLVVIAGWIRFDSTGPIFFGQTRVGRDGRLFRIHKFRTMIRDADRVGPALTTAKDSRVTRVGAFLRRYKLDELPQLWNVLRGDMSLVGPRPDVPEYIAHYTAEERATVLSVRPGLTDPASIIFAKESDLLDESVDPERMYLDVILPEKIRIYREYVATRSFWGDLALILRTLRVIMMQPERP